MQIIPAIDIRNGKCVRLTQGDFAKEKIYNDDPLIVAKGFEQEGATMLHIVDLDGAKNGEATNWTQIKAIAQQMNIPIEVGGGVRKKRIVDKLLANGVTQVILGTIVLEDKEELKKILKEFAPQVTIALDTKNGSLMKNGWLENSDINTLSLAQELEEMGAKRFIYTDVVRDGMMTQPNFSEIDEIIKDISVPVIVGGGISSLDDIKKLQSIGVEGTIIGKSLYEGKLNLKEVINAC